MSQDNIDLVKGIYDAFSRGDIEAVLAGMGPEVELIEPGPAALPFSGFFKGHEGAREFFAKLDDTIEYPNFGPTESFEFLALGDRVIVLGGETGTVKKTGAEIHADWAHFWTIQDQKIVRMQEFIDQSGYVLELVK